MTSKYPTCCVSNHRFLGMVQNRCTCAIFPGIISSVVAIIKARNREICCRLRIFILFSIANLRMCLFPFRCSLKEESHRIKNMRKKKKSLLLEFIHDFVVACSDSEWHVYLFLKPDILMTACHLLTRVQSSTTKVNSPKNRARYDSGVQVWQRPLWVAVNIMTLRVLVYVCYI